MKGVAEPQMDRSFLPQAFPWMLGTAPGGGMEYWNLLDMGSSVPATARFGRSGNQYLEHRPPSWKLDAVNRGLDVRTRTVLTDPGGNPLLHNQTDGRQLWGGQTTVQIHDHSGARSHASFVVVGTVANNDNLNISWGTGNEDFILRTDSCAIVTTNAVAYNQISVNYGTGTKVYRAGFEFDLGTSDAEANRNFVEALRRDVASGAIPDDLMAAAFGTLLQIHRYDGDGTLAIASTGGFATAIASTAAQAGRVRLPVSVTGDAQAQAIEFSQALQWAKWKGRIADITWNLVQGQRLIQLFRPAPGAITLTFTANAGPTFASAKQLGSTRPLRGKLRLVGRDFLERKLSEEIDFVCEADAPGEPGDFIFRSRFCYKICVQEFEGFTGHDANDFVRAGLDYRWNSLRVTLLGVGADTQTYTLNDGTSSVVYELDNNASVTGGRVLVTIGGTANITAANLAAAINASAAARTIRSSIFAEVDGNAVFIWERQPLLRASLTHTTSAGATFYLERGSGAFGNDDKGFRIGIPWLVSSVRDVTCVKMDRTPTGFAGGAMANNSRGASFVSLERPQYPKSYSLQVTLLVVGADGQTYTIQDGYGASKTFELDNNAAVGAGRRLVTIGGTPTVTATNLQAQIVAAVAAGELHSSITVSRTNAVVQISGGTLKCAEGLQHSTSTAATFGLDWGPGIWGQGWRAPYVDEIDNAIVLNGQRAILCPAKYGQATFTDEEYPIVGRHLVVFQYDPELPQRLKYRQRVMPGDFFR